MAVTFHGALTTCEQETRGGVAVSMVTTYTYTTTLWDLRKKVPTWSRIWLLVEQFSLVARHRMTAECMRLGTRL